MDSNNQSLNFPVLYEWLTTNINIFKERYWEGFVSNRMKHLIQSTPYDETRKFNIITFPLAPLDALLLRWYVLVLLYINTSYTKAVMRRKTHLRSFWLNNKKKKDFFNSKVDTCRKDCEFTQWVNYNANRIHITRSFPSYFYILFFLNTSLLKLKRFLIP